jgi:hypothetical protein
VIVVIDCLFSIAVWGSRLNVYAFDGDTYTGYSGTTDDAGQVVFTLPVGAYRFRADYDGVPFWSGTESTSFYLYGRGVIGTKTDTSPLRSASGVLREGYVLQGGLGSTRQLATHEGVISMSVSYTPWGDTLEVYGSGGIDFGYLGGMYDDATGRMLTRGAGQSNPYKPGAYDPAGSMIAPLALIGLALGKKKKRSKWDTFIAVLVVCVVVGMSVSACGPKAPAPTPPPNQPPTGTPSPGPGNGKNVSPKTTETPAMTPTTPADECNGTPSPTPYSESYLGKYLITHYTIPLETDGFFAG